MAIYQLADQQPQCGNGSWVAESAQVIGDVQLGENSSVWPGVVIRADNETVVIGAGTNIQDNAVLHSDPGSPLTLGERVTVGHQVMLHGCSVGDGSLVGIGAIVLNGARIGRNCLVGALVTEGKVFEDGQLIVGAPAKAVRPLTAEQIAGLGQSADHYISNARRFAADMKRVD